MKARAIATVALLGLLAGCAPSTSAASTATVTADEQRTGLSGRAEVPEGTGMLFTFAGRQERQVWMAGMQTRIDAAWIVDDQVLAVETLDPCTMTDQSMCPRWTSPGDVDALLAFAAEQLAPYKRPRRVRFVDALPRNASGKVLKFELRAPYWEDRSRGIA